MRRAAWALGAVVLVTLACRPVLAIGWGEMLVIGLVIALLLGPVVVRFWRVWERYKGSKRE